MPKNLQNYHIVVLISHASEVMLKILQARLQEYMNQELPDVQAGFIKADEPEIKSPTSTGSQKKTREFQKNFYFTDYAKVFDYMDHNKPWKIQDMGIPTTLPVSWETCMRVKKQQLEADME